MTSPTMLYRYVCVYDTGDTYCTYAPSAEEARLEATERSGLGAPWKVLPQPHRHITLGRPTAWCDRCARSVTPVEDRGDALCPFCGLVL